MVHSYHKSLLPLLLRNMEPPKHTTGWVLFVRLRFTCFASQTTKVTAPKPPQQGLTFYTDKTCITCTWSLFGAYSFAYSQKRGHNSRLSQLSNALSSLFVVYFQRQSVHWLHISLTTECSYAHLCSSLQGWHFICSPDQVQSGYRTPNSSKVQHCCSVLPDTPQSLLKNA